MAGLGRWLYWLGGCAILAYMGWNLIWSDHGYLVYRQEAAKLQQLQQQVAGLRDARERLASEVLRLRNDPEALEELIHRELGYVHPDEYMVMMPSSTPQKGK